MPVTQTAINELSEQIAARFRPERIILFGSHARGEATEVSDVDFLVVMPVAGREMDKALEIIQSVNPRLP